MFSKIKKTHVIFLTGFLLLITVLYFQPEKRNQKMADFSPYILEKISECYKNEGKNRCYQIAAEDFISKFPLEEILKVIEQHEANPQVYASCHEITHHLGREEYKQSGNVGSALAQCSYTCFSGCLHGVAEGYVIEKNLIAGNNSEEAIRNEIPKICGKRDEYEKTGLFDQCVHGIGHATMLLSDNEVPQALKFCDALHTVGERELCYSGVFMENSNSSTNKDHPSKYVKADDPFYPCTILEEQYKKMCYELQSFKFFESTGMDWKETFALCNNVPKEYQASCYKTLGSSQVGFTQDPKVMKGNCDLVQHAEHKDTCIEAVVGTLSTRFGGDISRMENFCSLVNLENKKSCYTQIGTSLKGWVRTREEIRMHCSEILEKQYQVWCEEGS